MGLLGSIANVGKGIVGMSPFGALANGVIDNTLGAADNMPQLQTANLDSDSQNLIRQREELAGQSPEAIALQRTQGVDRSKDLAAIQGGMGIQNSNLMGSQPAGVQEALKRRADKGYAQSLTKIQNQAKLDAVSEKAKARQQALQARFQEAQSKANILHAQDMEQYNNRAARNNALSSLLGTGMGIAGAAFGAPGAGGLAPKQQSYETGTSTASAGGRQNSLSATV